MSYEQQQQPFNNGGLSPSNSIYSFNITLQRDNQSIPWGFKLEGGKDYESPLVIQRVFQGSPAGSDLQRGDIILAIETYDATGIYQHDANDLLVKSSTSLNLTIKRGIPYPCSDGDAFYKRRQQYYQQYLSNNNENTQQALISPVAPPTPIQPVQPVQPKMQFFQNPYTVNPPSEQPQRTYVDIPYPGYSLDPPAKPMFRPTIEQHEEINPTFKPNQIDPSLLNALSPGFYADPNAAYRSKPIEKYTAPKPILSQTGSPYLPFSNLQSGSASSKVKVYKPSKTTPIFSISANQQQFQTQQDPIDERDMISKVANTVIQRAQGGGPAPTIYQQQSSPAPTIYQQQSSPAPPPQPQQTLNVQVKPTNSENQWQSINQQPQFSPRQNNLLVKSPQAISNLEQSALVSPVKQAPKVAEIVPENDIDVKLVNKQYNTPIGLYAKDTIKDEIKKRTLTNDHHIGFSDF